MAEVITRAEQEELLNWICSNWFTTFNSYGHNFKRTLFFTSETENLHPLLPIVFKRIVEREGLPFKDIQNKEDIHFCHILTCILPGGQLDYHTDDTWKGLYQCRFNLCLLQPQKGGETFYDGHPIPVKERWYHVCRSSLDPHWVEVNEDSKPRIVISFCYLMTKGDLNTKYPPNLETKTSNICIQNARAKHKMRVQNGQAYEN